MKTAEESCRVWKDTILTTLGTNNSTNTSHDFSVQTVWTSPPDPYTVVTPVSFIRKLGERWHHGKSWLQKQEVLTPDGEFSILTLELRYINLEVNWSLWSPISPLVKRRKTRSNDTTQDNQRVRTTAKWSINITSYDLLVRVVCS